MSGSGPTLVRKRPAADVASDTRPSIVVPSASAVRRWFYASLLVLLRDAGWSEQDTRELLSDAADQLEPLEGRDLFERVWILPEGRDVPRLMLAFKERFGSKTPLFRPPPQRCQPRPLLMRRSLGLVPKPRRRFARGLLASAASSGCELYLLSLAACDVPPCPWSLLMVLSAYASDATDPRKTCDGVPAMFGARLSLPCCPSYPALYACLPSVHAVMLHSLAVAFRPLRGESYSTLCSPRSLQCLPQLRHEPCLSQAWNWGARYRKPRPLPAPRRKLRGWQRRRYWAGMSCMWSPVGLALTMWPSSALDHAGPYVVAAPVPSPGVVAIVVRAFLSLVYFSADSIPYLQPLQK